MNALDTIIRKISKENEKTSEEVLVIINAKDNSSLGQMPSFFERINKSIELYAVSSINSVKCAGINFRFGEELIKIPFTISIVDGKENLATEILLKSEGVNLEDKLNNRIRRIVRNFVDEQKTGNELPNDFDELKSYIKEQAKQLLHLKINATIGDIVTEKVIKINSKVFEIRVEEEPLTMSFELEYEIDNLNKRNANADKYLKLEASLTKEIKDYLLQKNQVSLHNFVYHFDNKIKPELQQKFINTLEGLGLKMRYVVFATEAANSLKPKEDPILIDHTFDSKIEEYNEKVNVNVVVRLKLRDLGQMRKVNKGEQFASWFKLKVLIPIVEKNLFGKTYKDLLLDINDIRKNIAKEIEAQANSVGYDVEYHVFFPDIKKLKLVEEGFSFKEIEGSYKTKDYRVSVPIVVIAKGKLDNLKDIDPKYLQPQVDLENAIKETIIEAVTDILHKEEPEAIYLKFSIKDDENNENVKEKLENGIKDYLAKTYKINKDSLTINVRTGENDITDKALELRINNHKINFDIHPEESQTGDVQLINYTLIFKVLGVRPDGWATFQENSKKRNSAEEIAEIKDLLLELLDNKLKKEKYDIHISSDPRAENYFNEKVLPVLEEVGFRFGLSLDLIMLKRNRTHLEKTVLDIKVNDINESAKLSESNEHRETDEAIKVLRENLRYKIIKGADEEEIDEIEKRIERLENMKKKSGRSSNMLDSHKQKNQSFLLLDNPSSSKENPINLTDNSNE
ncbi:MAG: hypothetical protein MUF58_15380 [Arcicella sp.]|jgi:hypothetical protein|nr:hypothetical protein [Arcicella sp.]